MSGGSLGLPTSNFSDKVEKDDEISETNFVDVREDPKDNIPHNKSSITTGSVSDLAKEEKIGLKKYLNTVRAEERVRFLGNCAYLGVGTTRMEVNQIRGRNELRRDSGRKVGAIVSEMEVKEADARREAGAHRSLKNRWKRSIEDREDITKGQVNKMLKRLNKKSEEMYMLTKLSQEATSSSRQNSQSYSN